MNKSYQTHRLDWRGIGIEVRYCPSWSAAYDEIYGEPLAHLAIETLDPPRSPLPVTETGFRSHFIPARVIDEEGGPVPFVLGWLDEAAQSPRWRQLEANSRQLSLL